MNAKELYGMKLGDVLYSGLYTILRVPGGWMFTHNSELHVGTKGSEKKHITAITESSVFVPMNSEFRRQEPKA